jgi:hypothetical protein
MTAPTMQLRPGDADVAGRPSVTRYEWRTLSTATAGGAALVAGALLPWITFYAGLQPVAGTRGAYGRALLIAGLVACIVGAVRARIDARWARLLLALIGGSAVVAGALLFGRAWQLTHSQGALMLVPRMGPGLVVVMAGGAMVLLLSLSARRG